MEDRVHIGCPTPHSTDAARSWPGASAPRASRLQVSQQVATGTGRAGERVIRWAHDRIAFERRQVLVQGLPSTAQLSRLCAGMIVLTGGQTLLAQGHAFVMAQRPLDWVHWLLLLGAVTLTWRLTDIPVGWLGRLGRLATIAGATAFIGMSVIDFTLWALPSEMARQTFGSLILHVPAISLPFLSVGPSLLFVGLGVMVLEWVVVMRWRVWLVLFGIVLVGVGQFGNARWLVVEGHLVTLAGLGAMWVLVRSQTTPLLQTGT